MARNSAAWGIDIGQCALKALRCRQHESEPNKLTAEAFDYIEYPKILSQPDADPAELVREALEQFLSRNSVRGDKVAISVSGQSGLARFIKLPPVESKKIPDIVKYEARQQIPFALEDVVWDYQQMAGGSETDGFAMETEVGLFAMKRDQVHRALKPFDEAGIEVDVLQLTPLSIYNFTVFDQMQELPPPEDYDPDNPPESVVVLSLGTDTTDLVVTNGYRVWQRSVPLGGNHFTKALTKELRLTFAKAEHLKRNATAADDPKAVFQAMRPVFNDLLTEIQRSIGFFTGLDRKAKIGRVVALGNAMKLPGLQKYLSQNLGYPVTEVSSYRALTGSSVISSPIFKENLLSFAVSYGLTIQSLGKSTLSTNLLPREIVRERMIRSKQPWAVAAAALVLLGCSLSYAGHSMAWKAVNNPGFKEAFPAADGVAQKKKTYIESFDAAEASFKTVDETGQRIVGNVEGRMFWLELMKAIDQGLPHDANNKSPEDIEERNELHVDRMECEHYDDVGAWFHDLEPLWVDLMRGEKTAATGAAPAGTPPGDAPAPAANPPAASPAPATDAAAPPPGPTGEGWVIEIIGHHYHNKRGGLEGAEFVRQTLIDHLRHGTVTLKGKNGQLEECKVSDLGVGYPMITHYSAPSEEEITTDEDEPAPMNSTGKTTVKKIKKFKRFDFVVQFLWQPNSISKRAEIVAARKAEEAQKAQEAAKAANPEANNGSN